MLSQSRKCPTRRWRNSGYTTGVERIALWLNNTINKFSPVPAVNFTVQPRQAGETCGASAAGTLPFLPWAKFDACGLPTNPDQMRPPNRNGEARSDFSSSGSPWCFWRELSWRCSAVCNTPTTSGSQHRFNGSGINVFHLPPWAAIQAYRLHFAPGIETPMEAWFQGRRERMAVGMVIAGVVGIAGVIIAAVGVFGLSRRKRS